MLTKSPSGLDQLRSIQSQVNKLIDDFESSGSALPSLDEPGLPGRDLPDQNPTLEQISILARQLQAVCDGPRYTLTKAIEFHVSSCLRLAVAAHVEEILREAGQPLSANEIAKFSSLNPDKLAQCLRLLASNHIFVEVEKGVFARNRLSAILDTGKSLDFIKANPLEMFSDAGNFAAMILVLTDEGMKSSACLPEHLLSSSTTGSTSAFSLAYPGQSWWGRLAQDEQLRNRFSCAMPATGKFFSGEGETILEGFPWNDLPEDSIVVDVGGGTGHTSFAIGSAVQHLHFVIQDRPEVIENDAAQYWDSSASPELLPRVKLQVHNMFLPQPVKNAAVYFLRYIIHDWSDAEAVEILSQIAQSAGHDSRLVIIESTMNELSPPHPFPCSTLPYLLDLQMMAALGTNERTELQYQLLAEKAGWRLVNTWKTGKNGQDGAFRHYEFMLKSESSSSKAEEIAL